MSPRPLIAIVLDEAEGALAGFSRRAHYALRKDYFDAISALGADPVGVGYAWDVAESLMRRADGWLIPGADYRFAPHWYDGEAPADAQAPSARRDFEQRLIPSLLAQQKPVLGVCNGMQVMCAALGAKVRYHPFAPGDAVRHQSRDDGPAEHTITIAPHTKLAAILGAGAIVVNSSHKEQILRAPTALLETAHADDGVVEAVEAPHHPFAIGVQWHPELSMEREGAGLFGAFIEASRRAP